MSEQEKKWQRIYDLLNATPPQISEIIGDFYGLDQAQTVTPWLCYIRCFRKQKKCNLPSKYWFASDCYWGGME